MSFLTLNDGLNTNDKLSQLLKSLSRFKLDLETALEQQPCEEPLLNYKLSHINNQRARTPQNRDNRFPCNFEKRDRSSFIPPVGEGRGGWMIQMATMVISDTTNMKIARERLPRKNIRSQINNKTRQDIALGQVFKGIVVGRKSPKHDLYLRTDGYYVSNVAHSSLSTLRF